MPGSRPCKRNLVSRDYLPPDTPPSMALAADREADDSGWGLGFILLLVLVGVVVWFAWRRLGAGRRAREAGGASGQPSGTSYRPDWFRVGMTFPVDPAPFILAANMTHVRAPEGATDSGLISVEAVGEVTTDGVHWHRLYLPGGQCFFQVHLDADGRPDECRYFSLLDEIVPAGPEEWAFWLDAAEGAIGWPEFQTKDGKVYTRVWSQGDTRVAPRVLTETLTHATGTTSRERQAMLYAAPTGAEATGPGDRVHSGRRSGPGRPGLGGGLCWYRRACRHAPAELSEQPTRAKETKEKTMEPTITTILPRLGSGLSVLLLHLLTTLALLALGALCYMGVTPFRERTLIAAGNTAAGLVLAGTLIALAIPLAAMLATSHVWLDIVVWGLVAVILQLATFVLAVVVFRNLRAMIEADNVAAAAALVGVQIAIALLNAAAMAG